MTDEELLSRAVEFDAGPPPLVYGKLFDPSWLDAYMYRVRVVQRYNVETGQVKWAISDELFELSKTGTWEYATTASLDVLNGLRYDSAREAFDHYFRWRAAVLAWAETELAKAKPGEHVVLEPPSGLKF